MKGNKSDQHAKNHNQSKNTRLSQGKALTPFSKFDSSSNILNESSTKLSTRQTQLIDQILESIMLKPQTIKNNVDKSATTYQLCVTSSSGNQDFHNVNATSKIINDQKRFQHEALQHLSNDHGYLNRDNIDQYKRIRKIQRLKLFSQRQLEDIVNIINQSFLFMADPEEYDVVKMKQVLKQHVSINQYPIAKSAIGQELIKDGIVLLSIIEILAYYSLDQMLYKYKAFNTMSNLQIETHYDQFWQSAKAIFFIVNSSNKQKIDTDEQSLNSISSSESQTSSNQSSKKSQEDKNKNLLSVDWKPVKSATQQQSHSRNKKKTVTWNHASQPVQSTHSFGEIQEPLGSCYTYKVSESKEGGKVLKEVRKSARIKEQNVSKQKNNAIVKKQVEQKQQIQQWLKNSRPSQIKVQDCVHDKIDLFQALTPQDLEIKKLFEQKIKEKNIKQSPESDITSSVLESSSQLDLSQSQTSSSSLSDKQRQEQVYQRYEEQVKDNQIQREEQEEQQLSEQQKQEEINRSRKLQDQAKRQQKNLNVARFINRPFNPESPSKIIYEVDEQYRQSSSHYKNLATSNKAVFNSSSKRISQQEQRILRRQTQKNPNIQSNTQNEQIKTLTSHKKKEQQKKQITSPIEIRNPFLKMKQCSPIFIEPIPPVEIIKANQAKQKSPRLNFCSKKLVSKQHLKRPTYIIRYQQIKQIQEDVQFTPVEIKKQQSVKKVHFNDQLLTTVNWYQPQSNPKSKSKQPTPIISTLQQYQQQKHESPLKQSLLNFSLSTDLNSQQKSISNNSNHSNDVIHSNHQQSNCISPSKNLIESKTIHSQSLQIKQFYSTYPINNQQQIRQETKQINYSNMSPSKQITDVVYSESSQSKSEVTNRSSKKMEPYTHVIQNNEFKQTYKVINNDVVITRQSKKQKEQETHKINFKVEEIQMIPSRLISANLNGNNNYALIELDPTSAFDLGTKYTFVPLRMGLRLDRRQVLADHNQGIRILQTDDIGYIGLTPLLKQFIEREGKMQAQRKSKEKFYITQ